MITDLQLFVFGAVVTAIALTGAFCVAYTRYFRLAWLRQNRAVRQGRPLPSRSRA